MSAWSKTFIDCLVTKAPRAKSELDSPGRWVRTALPDVYLDAVTQPGIGVALWLHATDVQELHSAPAGADVPITAAPIDGPFGRTFTFADPDGYLVTIHDQA